MFTSRLCRETNSSGGFPGVTWNLMIITLDDFRPLHGRTIADANQQAFFPQVLGQESAGSHFADSAV